MGPLGHQEDPCEVGRCPEFGSSELKCKSHEQIRVSKVNACQPIGAHLPKTIQLATAPKTSLPEGLVRISSSQLLLMY